MSENQKRILEMLAENKISVDEAERLLSAVEQPASATNNSSEGFIPVPLSSSWLDITTECLLLSTATNCMSPVHFTFT